MRADTINCSEIRPLLSDFVDGETTAAESARIEAHVPGCTECASHLAFLRLSKVALLSAYPTERPSHNLSARIALATYARPTLGERVAEWFRPAPVRLGLGTAIAASLAAAVIVPSLNRPSAVRSTKVAALPAAPAKTKKTVAKPIISPAQATKNTQVVSPTAPAPIAVPAVNVAQEPSTKSFSADPVKPMRTEKTERIAIPPTAPKIAENNDKPLKPLNRGNSGLTRSLPKTGVQAVAKIPDSERGFVRTELPFRHITARDLPRPEVKHNSPLPTPAPSNMPLVTPEIKIPDAPRVATAAPVTPVDKPEVVFSPAVDTPANGAGRRFRMSLAGSGTHPTPGRSTTIDTRLGRQNAGISEGASYALVSAPVK